MSYLEHVRRCNTGETHGFRPLFIGSDTVGWVREDHLEPIKTLPHLFEVGGDGISLHPDHQSFEQRSQALKEAAETLAERGIIPCLRHEDYEVALDWKQPALARLDRGAMSFFGFRCYGVHVNGFVKKADGLHMWLGRRAADRIVAPNALDNMTAGGQPYGLSLAKNLVKEMGEEAGLSADIAAQAQPAGAVNYRRANAVGLQRDTMFVYDLLMPESLIPVNQDGEVASFELLPMPEVARLVQQPDLFKFNVGLIVIDFLIRHGFLNADNEPDYLPLLNGLHRQVV